MNFRLAALAAALALSGCKSKEDQAKAKAENEDKPRIAHTIDPNAPPLDAAPAGQPIATMFPKPGPALPPPFAGVTLMETKLATIDPKLTDLMDGKVDAFPNVRFHASKNGLRHPYSEDTVNLITMTFPAGVSPKDAMIDAWGPGIEAPDNSGERVNDVTLPARYWFSPADRLRVRLTEYEGETTVAYTQYTPLSVLVGPKGGPFGFEGDQPLLGRTLDDVKAAWGVRVDWITETDAQLHPAGAELDTFDFNVMLGLDAGKVARWSVLIPYADDGNQQAWLQAITEKLGEPKQLDWQGTLVRSYSTRPSIELVDQPGTRSWQLTVQPEPPPR